MWKDPPKQHQAAPEPSKGFQRALEKAFVDCHPKQDPCMVYLSTWMVGFRVFSCRNIDHTLSFLGDEDPCFGGGLCSTSRAKRALK